MKRGVCDECRGSAVHLEVQQFNMRSNEEARLRVSEHRERMEQEHTVGCQAIRYNFIKNRRALN